MTKVTEQDLCGLVDEIWLTTLGLGTHPMTEQGAGLDAAEPTLDGIINITGEWQGTVMLQVPRPLAETMAGKMFRLDGRKPRNEDVHDALGEITNQLGGNIKALLDGQCHLSLPAVVEGHGYTVRVPSACVVQRYAFACEGRSAVVSLTSMPG
jgi:CheY-specific phosphatase CheX